MSGGSNSSTPKGLGNPALNPWFVPGASQSNQNPQPLPMPGGVGSVGLNGGNIGAMGIPAQLSQQGQQLLGQQMPPMQAPGLNQRARLGAMPNASTPSQVQAPWMQGQQPITTQGMNQALAQHLGLMNGRF